MFFSQSEYGGLGNQQRVTGFVPPQVKFKIGVVQTTLRDAVVVKEDDPGGSNVLGNAGADLLPNGFDLDFRQMVLSLDLPEAQAEQNPANC